MLIYFDSCALQRPFDDLAQPRIVREAEAMQSLLKMVDHGRLQFVDSEVLRWEIEMHPIVRNRSVISELLNRAHINVAVDDTVANRAREFQARGCGNMDALHLASAERADVDAFCTTDDRLLKFVGRISGFRAKVVLPETLLAEFSQ